MGVRPVALMAVMAMLVAVSVMAVVVVVAVAVGVTGSMMVEPVGIVPMTVVAVVVEHDEVLLVAVLGVVSEQPVPKRLPQPILSEHLVGGARGDQPVGHQHHRVAVPGLVQVVGSDDHDGAP